MKVNKVKRAIIAAFAAVFAFVAPAVAADTVLPNGIDTSSYQGDNTVYDGTKYYDTLQAAVEAVCGTAGAMLYCKPGADVGSLQHAPVTATLTIYGNGAYVSGGSERDFDIGNTDPSGGKDITADMTLTVKDLEGCGAWGAKATEHTVNLVFEDCQDMGKVFITGTTGTLNITIKDSTFEGVIKEAVYSNADGAITLTNVDFSNLNKAVNLNHKATGTQMVTITDCSFADCGANVASDQIPVRVLSSVEGGKSVLTVSGTTFTGTPEGGADILLDYGIGETTANISTADTAANVVVEKTANVGTITIIPANTQNQSFVTVERVALIGDTKYKTLYDAVKASTVNDTITLLQDAELAFIDDPMYNIFNAKELDLNGKTLTIKDGNLRFSTCTIKNGNIVVGAADYSGNGVFYMFDDKVLTLDNVKLTAENFTGYSIFCMEGNSDLVLQNGTEITVKNANLYGIVAAVSEGEVTIDNAKITGETITGRGFLNGNYTIKGTSEITLTGVTKDGFYIGAGDTLNIQDTSKVDITLNADGDNRYGINISTATSIYTKAGTATVNATLYAPLVAKIGTAEYTTLAAAVAEATEGQTITLISDVQLTEMLTIPAGKTVTLDLNGKQITSGYQKDSTTKHIYPFDVYGTFTIEDTVGNGSITGRGIFVQDGSKLTIESGAVYAIDSNGGSVLFQYGGDIVINGGHIEQKAEGTYNFAINGLGGTVTVNNGWVGGNHGAIAAGGAAVVINGGTLVCTGTPGMTDNVLYSYDTGSITINGGTFIGDSDTAAGGCCVYDANGGATINGGTFGNTSGGDVWGTTGTTIKGGTFSDLIEKQHIADGFELNADGQVVAKPAVAQIGETPYATLEEAIAAAQEGETITLLKDISVSDSILIDKSLVLDLNSKIITSSHNRSIKINTNGNAAKTVIIKNGTVISTPDAGRCIQLMGDALERLELNGVTFKAEKGQSSQTITLAETNSTKPLEFVVKNSTVVASNNNGYACIFFCPIDATIENSTISGYAALYFKNAGVANTSEGSVVDVIDSNLIGTNVQGGKNTFGTITTEANNVTINVSGGSITANKTNDALQTIVYCGWYAGKSTGLVASLNTELLLGDGCRILAANEDISAQTVAVRAEYADEVAAEGFSVGSANENGLVSIVAPVAKIGETKYTSLADAFAAAQTGDTVTFLCDVEQTDGVLIADKKLAINLNGKTFTVSNGGSTNNRNFKINGASEVVISNGTMVAAGDYNSGAYGTVRTEGTAKVELQDLKLYNYRGNGLNVKACTGTSVTMTDVEIYAQYGGGVEAAGGTIELTDVVVLQKGMYTAPYNSMAISVNGGGTVIVQSGTYSTECLTAEEANNQGTSHGPWVAGVLNSGGTLIINGGMFSNDNFGENSLATHARGAILADTAANIQINGGTFNALKAIVDIQNNLGNANKNPSCVLAGGTFSADPCVSANYGSNLITVKEGYLCAEQNSDPVLWKVGRLPSAEVVNLGPVEVGPDGDYTFGDNYYVYDLVGTQKMTTSSEPFDLQIALDFIAKDTVAQASNNAFGNYTTDFYITIDGIKDGSFVADENCYLAGYYPLFNAWVKIPLTGFKIEDRKVYPVITSAGFDFKYTDICGSVGDFICGIHLSDAVLHANPDLKVKLELGLSKTYDDALAADKFVGVDQPYEYDVEDMTSAVAVTGPDYYTTVESAIAVALETGDFVKLVKDSKLEENLTLAKHLDFNLGGNTLSANGKSLAIGNTYVAITNGTLAGFTSANITLTGNAVLTVTDKNVADSFRTSVGHYVSQNANGTYSIMLKSAFRVFITMVDGEPRIGFFKDFATGSVELKLVAATNLEKPDWQAVAYVKADDSAGASTLPLYWVKLNQAADDANVYRFFKLAE